MAFRSRRIGRLSFLYGAFGLFTVGILGFLRLLSPSWPVSPDGLLVASLATASSYSALVGLFWVWRESQVAAANMLSGVAFIVFLLGLFALGR